jgi:esterase/lipase
MKKIGVGVLIALGALTLLYLLGPQPDTPEYNEAMPKVPPIDQIESFVMQQEGMHPVRKNNEAKTIWAGETGQQTEYVFLYLHGFSASEMEGFPVNRNVPAHFGSNAFMARLYAHGLDTIDALINYTADRVWNSAKEALAIAETLGDKVIIMSTSTGGTLAYSLAAKFPKRVHALINLSPNVQVLDPNAYLLNNPWGYQIAYVVLGGSQRHIHHPQPRAKEYWDTVYHTRALVELEELLETSMTKETFAQVKAPILTLYYYKNEQEKDQVVDVSVLEEVHTQLGTPDHLKVTKALSTPGNHVIASDIKSSDWLSVQQEIIDFLQNTVQVKRTKPN